MPSHPDRVRRNYHDIKLETFDNPVESQWDIHLSVTRALLASTMSARELQREIARRWFFKLDQVFK